MKLQTENEENWDNAKRGRVVLPQIMGQKNANILMKKRGRPPKTQTKQEVTLRLDKEVIDAFRAGGPGWQTNINTALHHFIDEHPNS